MAKISAVTRAANAHKAAVAATIAVERRTAAYSYYKKYGREVVSALIHTAIGAKGRCRNKNDRAYINYGGRGIEFRFPTVRNCAEWILDNLGPKPTPQHSLDRIDNSRHYEPGNLRWATREEQANNKRAYKRTVAGERIRNIMAERGDLTYECIRNWIKQGATDDEILQRKKYARPGV